MTSRVLPYAKHAQHEDMVGLDAVVDRVTAINEPPDVWANSRKVDSKRRMMRKIGKCRLQTAFIGIPLCRAEICDRIVMSRH